MFVPLNTNPLPVGLCKGTCEEKMIYVFFYLILAHNTEYRTFCWLKFLRLSIVFGRGFTNCFLLETTKDAFI